MKEKFTKYLNKYGSTLLGHSSVYLITNILNAAIPLVLLPVLTRYLTLAEYGVLGMFQMTLAVMGAFAGLNVHAAANRKYYDQDRGIILSEFISSCMQIVIVMTCILSIVVYLAQNHLYHWTGINPQWLLIGVIVSGTSIFTQIRLGQWQVRNLSLYFGSFQIGQSFLNLCLSLLLVVVMLMGLNGRLLGQSLPPIIFGIIAIILLYRDDLLKFSWRPKYILSALSFGLPLLPHTLGLFMLSMLDRLIITHFLGLESVGIYLVAIQIAMGIAIISDAINKAYVPWLFNQLKANNHEDKKRIVHGTYIFFIIALIIASLIAWIAPVFVPWFAGKEYALAGSLMGWLVFGQVFSSMYMMVGSYIFYSQQTVNLSIVTITSGILHLILAYILIQKYELFGVAVTFFISMLTRLILTWIFAQKLHPMPWLTVIKEKFTINRYS